MRKPFFLLLLLSVSAAAQTPYLVKDINTTVSGETKSSSPQEFASFGNRIFFVATTDEAGTELWSTDGTSGGTVLVADIIPGPGSSSPTGLKVVNGLLLFTARDVDHGLELWRSDGTAAGTRMLLDLNPGPSSAQPRQFVPFKNGMLFSADDGTTGRELWFTDGTAGGTRLVRDMNPGAGSTSLNSLFPFGNNIYIYTSSGDLWKTDGTDAGTVKIMPLEARNFLVLGSQFLFEGFTEAEGTELWISDGTAAGTHMVTDLLPGPHGAFETAFSTQGFRRFGNGALFVANDGVHGRELWFTDGTAAGTRMVRDLVPGAKGMFDLSYAFITTLGDYAYFVAFDEEHGNELWRTDGTESGTGFFADLNPGKGSSSPVAFLVSGGQLFLVAVKDAQSSYRLWVTDGGAPRVLGTDGPYPTTGLWAIDGKVYFGGRDGLTGTEPWVTDGTDAGTRRIANLAADRAPSSNPQTLAAIGPVMFFLAIDPNGSLTGAQRALWRTDGTAGGTYTLLPNADRFSGYQAVGPLLFFRDNVANRPMVSDGTIGGTKPADDFMSRLTGLQPIQFYPFDDVLYFTARPVSTNDVSLWKTTFAPDAPVTRLGSTNPQKPISVAGQLYFLAQASGTNRALWTSDGTPGGTYAVIPELADYSQLSDIVNAAGTLYFIERRSDENTKLWKSDGTFDGTVVVTELPFALTFGTELTAAGRRVFFSAANMLWVSDGTAAGTIELANVKPASGKTVKLFTAGERVVFDQLDAANGHEVWSSDGTPQGTKLLNKMHDDPGLVSVDGNVYFAGTDDLHGSELWVTDGTIDGTKLLADVNAGPAGSAPIGIVKAGETLLFSAYTDATGRELWALPLADPRLSVNDATAVEHDAGTSAMRFTVTLAPAATQAVSVEYTTSDDTAHAGDDYDAASGTVTFAPGETTKTIDVRVRGDATTENNELFFVRLRNASGARLLKSEGVGIIRDDDQPADIAIEPLITPGSFDVTDSVKVTNQGPRTATDVVVKITTTPDYDRRCFGCGVSQLGSGASAITANDFGSPSAQAYIAATATARQSDPQASNNSAAWTVTASRRMAMDAAYLTTGATATVYGVFTGTAPVPKSSDPSVVSLGTPTVLGANVAKITVTGLKPGTSSVSFAQNYEILVTVVAPGTTPRWPGGLAMRTDFSATHFDQPLTLTVTTSGKALFTEKTATGTVIVRSGSQELARRTIDGPTSFTIPFYLPNLGSNQYEVSYGGDANFLPQSLTDTVFVHKGNATLTAALEPTGTAGTYTLTVRANGSPVAAPTGTLSFFNGAVSIGSAQLVASSGGISTARTTLTGVPASATLTINYSGDVFYDPGAQQVRSVAPHQRAIRR